MAQGYRSSRASRSCSSVEKKWGESWISVTPGSQNRFSRSIRRMAMSPSPLSFPASQNTPYTAHPDFSLYHHALEYVRLNPFFFSTTGRILVSFRWC